MRAGNKKHVHAHPALLPSCGHGVVWGGTRQPLSAPPDSVTTHAGLPHPLAGWYIFDTHTIAAPYRALIWTTALPPFAHGSPAQFLPHLAGCAPGYGGSTCNICSEGWFSSGGNATVLAPDCTQCPAGTTTPRTGSTSLSYCRARERTHPTCRGHTNPCPKPTAIACAGLTAAQTMHAMQMEACPA